MATTLNAPFQNIVAGSRATLSLPIGPTYHGILLYLASLTKANLTAIRVRLNKKIIYEVTGELLDKINTYKGGAVDDHFLLIDFTEHQSKDIVSELVGVIATGAGVTSFMVEIDIAAGATIGDDELKSWSMISSPIVDANPLTNIHTLTMQTHNLNGAKTWDIELPHGPSSAHIIKRVWLVESTGAGNITAAECRVNNLPILETNKAMNEFLQEHYESIPADGVYCLDFAMTNHAIHEALMTRDSADGSKRVQDLRLKVTTDDAVTVDVYIESLASFGLL